MDTQRLTWYLTRIFQYSCEEANEPVFTLRDIQSEFKVKPHVVMRELRAMHHLLEISFVPYRIRKAAPSRKRKRQRRTVLVDILFLPRLTKGYLVTFTDRHGNIRTVTSEAKYGSSFLYRRRQGKAYVTVEIPVSSVIDVSSEV